MVGRKEIILIFGVTCVYLILFAVTFWFLKLIQAYVVAEDFPFAGLTPLIILTHGFRVVLTWLWRERAVIYLLPGTAIQATVLVEHFALGFPEWVAMVLSFSCCSYVAFEVVKWFELNGYATSFRRADWRAVMFAGALAGLINGTVNMAVTFSHYPAEVLFWVVVDYFIGGMVGLVIWLFMMRFALRYWPGGAAALIQGLADRD